MGKKIDKWCLVLNANGLAVDLSKVSHVIRKVQNGRQSILDISTWERFTMDEWVKRGATGSEYLEAGACRFDLPEVAICNFYKGTHPVSISCASKQNVFKRDGFKCWYCGSKHALTVDHIVPQCEGGRLAWNNVITSCKSCNNRKDRMSVEEFCRQMKCSLPEPWNPNSAPWLFRVGHQDVIPTSWKPFIR